MSKIEKKLQLRRETLVNLRPTIGGLKTPQMQGVQGGSTYACLVQSIAKAAEWSEAMTTSEGLSAVFHLTERLWHFATELSEYCQTNYPTCHGGDCVSGHAIC